MNPEDLELLIQEFWTSREHWVEIGLQSIYHYADLETRNDERQFNLLLSMTTISVAFFTVVAPLIKNAFSLSLVYATCFFFLTSVLGIIILVVTIQRDKRLIVEDNLWEHQTLNGYLDQSVAIYSKLYDYKKAPNQKLWDDITSKVKEYFETKGRTDSDAKARKAARKQERSAVILRKLKVLFWVSLCVASVVLLFWLAVQISSK